ncbi:hypothetical protein AVEN_36669-1 [Araneus ventricosus]|uniref:Uncharacterized protein n=1 Tax=Araneus ventricosus TaxID=182803 RepID=A0A4Y2N602_ARAVE|nr:hypothetical protein AVEN_36669-1 [Araneus ventricosus]
MLDGNIQVYGYIPGSLYWGLTIFSLLLGKWKIWFTVSEFLAFEELAPYISGTGVRLGPYGKFVITEGSLYSRFIIPTKFPGNFQDLGILEIIHHSKAKIGLRAIIQNLLEKCIHAT